MRRILLAITLLCAGCSAQTTIRATTVIASGTSKGAIVESTSGQIKGASVIDFYANGANRWKIDSSGFLYPAVDNTQDIGATSSTFRPRTIYAATSVVAPLGTFTTGAFTTATVGAGGLTSLSGLSNFGVVHATSAIIPQLVPGASSQVFSATPTFDCSTSGTFEMTLTANVTSITITNPIVGQILTFIIHQDATGSRTWAWPASFKGATAIGSTLSTTSVQQFIQAFDGNFYAIAAANTNM